MQRRHLSPLAAVALALLIACTASAEALRFSVSFPVATQREPASGRLVVYLLKEGAKVGPRAEPADAPFFEDPQPCFGTDVKDAQPGQAMLIDDNATAYPAKLSALPAGTYKVQAVLDTARDDSSWSRENGNLYSTTTSFTHDPAAPKTVELSLTKVTKVPAPRSVNGAEVFTLKSTLLSDFHGREIRLRAGVALPINYDPARAYPVIYEVPGFGGKADTALFYPRMIESGRLAPDQKALLSSTFRVILEAESGNGHTLWADSANNGPWAKALVTELIPALEKKYKMTAKPEGRLIEGHSSGGWSALWLQVNHPDVFGGAWPSSPDPVDFRAFQRTDIYAAPNMYQSGAPAKDTPSFVTLDGKETMTVMVENLVEEVIGPRNTSGQQWDSWHAVFGPRAADGTPAALYDPVTGAIDKSVAEAYRAYDLGEMLRKNPDTIAPILRQRVRLVCGEKDNFGLNNAVALLKADLDRLAPAKPEDKGYVKLVPGDHGTVHRDPAMQGKAKEMLQTLKAAGVIGK